jgi:hypothetical protein
MRDKPKMGMKQKPPKGHPDAKQDKKMVGKMVKKDCLKPMTKGK